MTASVDVLVLGGGPAGSAVAAMAASHGARTLVVERERFPRDKVCGEFLSAEGCRVLERLGVLDRLLAAGAVWIGSCRLTHPSGPALNLELPALGKQGREALGVSRARLDSELLARAGECGAELLQPWEGIRPLLENGRVSGCVVRERATGRTTTVRARIVVGADGRRSMLARTLHPALGDPRRSGPRSWFGLQIHLDARGRAESGRIELHVFDGGYAGIGPVEGGRLNLGMIVTVAALRACGGSRDELFSARLLANPFLRRTLGDAAPCGSWRSIGPLRFGVRRPATAGALFVGDAAGTIDPFCGEGMANALCGAETAIPFVLEAVERGSLADDAAVRYARAWSAAFGPVTRRVRRLGRILERPRLVRPVLRTLAGWGRPLARGLIAATRTGSDG